MKVFFYVWCFLAAGSLIACFFNWGHIFMSLIPSVLMAAVHYPEYKAEKEDEK